jgi:fatty acid desaturase
MVLEIQHERRVHIGSDEAAHPSTPTDKFDDYSRTFHRIRSRLANDAGVSYFSFRSTLKPRYWIVWVHLTLAYVAIITVMVALTGFAHSGPVVGVCVALAASLPVGYAIAYVSLFFHAASHYELSANKVRNDWLANIFVGILFGYAIHDYRRVHFQHHRLLGLPEDPENGYIEALDLRFFVESLTGLRFLRSVLAHLRGKSGSTGKKQFPFWRAAGTFLHLTIFGGSLLAGQYPITIAWTIGYILIAPMVSAIRLVLEHARHETADHRSREQNVAVTRVFGDGPLAGTLGGAGFNRHLLHHWDPQVPYTRLADLEGYLRTTELGKVLDDRTTTYSTTFRKLFRIR